MKIICVGGGPASLYFSILMKRHDPRHQIAVFERNAPTDAFGWGVVFSADTLAYFAESDAAVHEAIRERFVAWSDMDVLVGGARIRTTGHGFCGLSRKVLLELLHRRAESLGVELVFGREVTSRDEFADADLIVAADGVNSRLRDAAAASLQPVIAWGRCRFSWLGTTLPLDAFTFIFKQNEHGLFQVHAYPFQTGLSTFIVECREEVWRRAGLDAADEAATVYYLERLFRDELRGHRLLTNNSVWRSFPVVTNAAWSDGNMIIMGDAAHTAHFSIGSGTKLAMEDAVSLAAAITRHGTDDLPATLAAYEAERRPVVERFQAAARTSQDWFENSAGLMGLDPATFTFSLLTRSKRVTYQSLAERDPALVRQSAAAFTAGNPWLESAPAADAAVPPLFQPFGLRGLRLHNRIVVSPMCQYSAADGTVGDWHLVHLGSRAVGGAGLVMTEATHVAADARITLGCAGLYAPGHVPAWKRIVDFVHASSRARIGVQLAHAGRKGACDLPWHGGRPLGSGGWELLAPSPLPFATGWPMPRAMHRDDMDRVRDQFVRAAALADAAGFDMVELHMAHGYLLGTFLSPLANHRDDDYGGSVERRLRYPLEVFDAVRAAWPADKPVAVRISATDWAPGGLDAAGRIAIAQALKDHGCDIVTLSSGGTVPDQKPVYGRMFNVGFSEEVRRAAAIPTMTVGNIVSADQCHTILAAGRADLCVLARGHLADPYFTLHAAAADGQDDGYWPLQYAAARRRS